MVEKTSVYWKTLSKARDDWEKFVDSDTCDGTFTPGCPCCKDEQSYYAGIHLCFTPNGVWQTAKDWVKWIKEQQIPYPEKE